MFYALFLILVGIVIGWNLPQPGWARSLQHKVVATVKGMLDGPGRRGGGQTGGRP